MYYILYIYIYIYVHPTQCFYLGSFGNGASPLTKTVGSLANPTPVSCPRVRWIHPFEGSLDVMGYPKSSKPCRTMLLLKPMVTWGSSISTKPCGIRWDYLKNLNPIPERCERQLHHIDRILPFWPRIWGLKSSAEAPQPQNGGIREKNVLSQEIQVCNLPLLMVPICSNVFLCVRSCKDLRRKTQGIHISTPFLDQGWWFWSVSYHLPSLTGMAFPVDSDAASCEDLRLRQTRNRSLSPHVPSWGL